MSNRRLTMKTFDKLRKTLPDSIVVPERLRDLCDAVDAGLAVGGSFQPMADTPARGKAKDKRRFWHAYFDNDAFVACLGLIGSDGGAGYFALWQPVPSQPARVAWLCSEGTEQFVIGRDFDDFLRFLALGFDDHRAVDLRRTAKQAKAREAASPSKAYATWLHDRFGLAAPRGGAPELVDIDDRELRDWIEATRRAGTKPRRGGHGTQPWLLVPFVSVGPLNFAMTRREVKRLFAEDPRTAGTVDMAALAKLAAEQRRDIERMSAKERAEMKEWGFTVESFMAPFDDVEVSVDYVAPLPLTIRYAPGAGGKGSERIRVIILERGAPLRAPEHDLDFGDHGLTLIERLAAIDPGFQGGRGFYSPLLGLEVSGPVGNHRIECFAHDPIEAARRQKGGYQYQRFSAKKHLP